MADVPLAEKPIVSSFDSIVVIASGAVKRAAIATLDARYDAAGLASAAASYAVQRANHTGTQDISTISGVGTAATHAATDFDAAGAAGTAQAYAVQRANHTGSQLAATISDFASAVIAAMPQALDASASPVFDSPIFNSLQITSGNLAAITITCHSITAWHIISSTNTPTFALHAGAGGSPSLTITGTDTAGKIDLTTGSVAPIAIAETALGDAGLHQEFDFSFSFNSPSTQTFNVVIDGVSKPFDDSITPSAFIAAYLGLIDFSCTDAHGTQNAGDVPYRLTFADYAPHTTTVDNDTGAGAAFIQVQGYAPQVNEEQTVTFALDTGGTWGIGSSFNTDLPYNATIAQLQTVLDAQLGSGTVTVSGTDGGPLIITWTTAGPQSVLAIDGSLLTGSHLGADVLKVLFALAYSAPPYVVLTPGNGMAASEDIYIESSTDGFTLKCETGLQESLQHIWSYHVIA